MSKRHSLLSALCTVLIGAVHGHEECASALKFDLDCNVADGWMKGQACGMAGFGITPCFEWPSRAKMLYSGGDCQQSSNRQFREFACEDTAYGPPPTQEGAHSYIVVTDSSYQGLVYFRGYVNVGDTYELVTPRGKSRFYSDLRINIYKNADTSNPSNLLQRLQFNIECNGNLELINRFGASQLVEFVNQQQGVVNTTVPVTFDLEIEIPSSSHMEVLTMQSLIATTDFAGTIDFTPTVVGHEIVSGTDSTALIVSIPVAVNAVETRRYSVTTELIAMDNASGMLCMRTDTHSLTLYG